MAWLLGGAVGVAAVLGAGGRADPVGIAAAIISAGSILMGKFFVVYFMVQQRRLGMDAAMSVFPDALGGFDILWMALASFTAFKIAKAEF